MARKKKISPDQAPMMLPVDIPENLSVDIPEDEPEDEPGDESEKPKKRSAKKKKATESITKPITHESNHIDYVHLEPPPPGFKRVIFRCTHTPFGFCTGEPEWSTLPMTHDGLNFHSGVCGNSPEKCWKFSKRSILMKDAPLIPFKDDTLVLELYDAKTPTGDSNAR